MTLVTNTVAPLWRVVLRSSIEARLFREVAATLPISPLNRRFR